jgi:Asp-tRNA(Asn)/Glu-tRNA(Gln) amidotransferase A subunit family amidase
MLPKLPTASDALARFRDGSTKPSELLTQILERVDALEDDLGAYVELWRERAVQAAAQADEAYASAEAPPLCGLPLSFKDLFALPGVAPSCGVELPPLLPAERAAPLLRQLDGAGVVNLGRVQLHPLAFGLDGENPQLGTPRNPRAPGCIPGGSSSGSAVSVAAGLALASIGTDTGGSVRVPAACCGIVGFKPTHGALDARAALAVAPSIDHVGVLARAVADCRLVFEALTLRSAGEPCEGHGAPRIGLLTDLHSRADERVQRCVEQALAAASELTVSEVGLGEALSQGKRAYGTLVLAEIAAQHEPWLETMADNYDAGARAMVEKGAELRAVDYLRADAARGSFRDAVHALLDSEDLDALALPTIGSVIPEIGQQRVDVNGRSRAVAGVLVENTSPFSLIGVPAISLPAGEVEGRPVGLQLVGRRGDDRALLALAEGIERALGGPAGVVGG